MQHLHSLLHCPQNRNAVSDEMMLIFDNRVHRGEDATNELKTRENVWIDTISLTFFDKKLIIPASLNLVKLNLKYFWPLTKTLKLGIKIA